MELVERYLQAVRFWLPKRQKDDILDELSADIHSQIEERESALGRALNEAEIEGLLKGRGHPMLVANRFLPQQHLIGPELFPIYKFVLKIFALGYLLPAILVWIGLMTLSPAYRGEQAHVTWFGAMESLFNYVWFPGCLVLAPLTVAFALLERRQAKVPLFDRWNPRNLPPLRNLKQISRAASVFELTMSLLFFYWWARYGSPRIVNLGTVHVEFSKQWVWFFFAFLLLAAAYAVLAAVNLLHPYWTVRRAVLRLLSDVFGGVLFWLLLGAHVVTSFSASTLSAEQALHATQAIDHWMSMALPWSIAVSAAVAAIDIYRIIRITPWRSFRFRFQA
jgi:hypothetical protein